MGLALQDLFLVGFVGVVGAALGAAIAHWKRGPGHLIVGALIGGLGTFLFALVTTVYAGVIGALSIIAVAVLVVFGALFS